MGVGLHIENAIAQIATALRESHPHVSDADVRKALEGLAQVSQIEFHPSDRSNESCDSCTHGHDHPAFTPPPVFFSFSRLDCLTTFATQAILLAGGGEPTLYKDPVRGHGFADVIQRIKELLPGCAAALITNGTLKVDRCTLNEFRWVRYSVRHKGHARTVQTSRLFPKSIGKLHRCPYGDAGASVVRQRTKEGHVGFAKAA